MASPLAVRKEPDWNHMSDALLPLWAIDMLLTDTSTFRYAAAAADFTFLLTDAVRLVERQPGVIGML